MRIKTFIETTMENLEMSVNEWLQDNPFKVARISHSCSNGEYTAIILYQNNVYYH